MFLFEDDKKNALYTGDFRFPLNSSACMKFLHDQFGRPKALDTIYVDTTFYDPNFTNFITREDCWELIWKEISQWLQQSPNHVVRLDCPCRFCYESLFTILHHQTGMKVHVLEKQYQQYHGNIGSVLMI
jgi:DNA cross-link repair 1C protein